MIVPALINWPPKRFTPSRCPCESRPFVEEPPPFLLAMTYSFSRKSAGVSPAKCEVLQLDVVDLHGGVILPVAARNLVLLALLELQHGDLFGASLGDNLAAHRTLPGIGPHYAFLPAGGDGQNRAQSPLFQHLAT